MHILERFKKEDESKLVELEDGLTNKWRWEWLEKTVELDPAKKFPKLSWSHGPVKIVAKDHIRKVDEAGKAICSLCRDSPINYCDAGLKGITAHLSTQKHLKSLGTLYGSQMLPGVTVPREMYGAPTAFYGDTPASTVDSATPSRPLVHVLDRVANMEAMIVAFLAENSLSFTISEELIELVKELAKDPHALKKLHMHRTTASYKLTYGLSFTWQNELAENLRKTPFSLNMDESTSSNTKHVFTVLVSYYNDDAKNIVVDHLGSIDVPSCTSQNLYDETKKLFETKSLPWKKLLAILADSASTMRGKISGVETLIRNNVAPHLLDIDGESCHHIHNIVKKLTSFFEYFLENLFRDVSNEFKFSADSLDLLREVTFYMNMKFRKPINFHLCRWLSVYDTSVEFDNFVDVHKVFFSAFEKSDIEVKIKRCDKELKKHTANKNVEASGASSTTSAEKVQDKKSKKQLKKEKRELIVKEEERKRKKERVLKRRQVSNDSRTVIDDNLGERIAEKFKTGTEKGRERKRRIISSLLHQPNYYTLLASFYQTVLPIFKSYVMLFQGDKPLIHKVYFKQIGLVKEFMSYFVRPDVLEKCKRGKHFLKLDLKNKENLLPRDLMFIGFKAKKLIQKLGNEHSVVVDFLNRVEDAYLKCGEYIQTKLPLENAVLKAFSAIDPLIVSSSSKNVLKRLLSLPTYVTTVLTEEEEEQYDKEVRAVCVDGQLPAALDADDNEVDCLSWWILISERYPCVFKMVRSILSIFHGPRVESTFNVMGDVIDKNSGRMNMETYSSVQDIKYGLKTRKPLDSNRAVKVFSRKERLLTPVNPQLSNNMRKSYKIYNRVQRKKRKEEKERRKQFEVENPNSTTSKKLKEDTAVLAEKASAQHQEILAKAYNLKRLSVRKVKEVAEAKDSHEEGDQTIEIDEDQNEEVQSEPTQLEEVQAEPIQLEEVQAEPIQHAPAEVELVQVESSDEDISQDSAASSKSAKKSKRGGCAQTSVPSKKRKSGSGKLQKSINRYFSKPC